MRRLLACLCLVLMLGGCSRQPMHDADGHAIRLSEIQNKWVFLNVWAPWCSPCHHEIPALNQFYQQHHRQVMVLGSDFDQPQQQALAVAVKKMGIHFPVLLENPAPLFHVNNIGVVPATFVINPQGKVVRQLMGPQTLASLNKTLVDVMAEQKA